MIRSRPASSRRSPRWWTSRRPARRSNRPIDIPPTTSPRRSTRS